MPLYFNEDQAMLADTVTGFIADEGAIKPQLRRLRDGNDTRGYDPALWKQFAEMGLTGILVSEADGGLGLGHVEAGIVLREIGRNLTPSPFLSTAVVGATALGHGQRI
jgi:alkylation response protein AidB-like acyl-CoA dehydrogenase